MKKIILSVIVLFSGALLAGCHHHGKKNHCTCGCNKCFKKCVCDNKHCHCEK